MSVTFLLVCMVLASLAAGVLVAYGLCVAMFGIFRIHARQVASSRVRMSVRPALEG